MVWLILSIAGSFVIRWNYHLEALHENPASDKIALTFDDGPTGYTEAVLDLLKEYDQKATFFLIGRQVEKYPLLVKRIVAEGHTVGNHTWSHSKNTGFLNAREMKEEIRAADRALREVISGQVKFYRPPFGVTNPSVKKAVQETGHTVMGWSIRSLDTVIRDEKRILDRIVKRLKPGKVILLHDTSQKSVNVVSQLLQELEERSLRSVSLDELFKLKAYEP
ncbi:Peptidoglycan-N-acetylglucosamine deacetylase [compost metagenome]